VGIDEAQLADALLAQATKEFNQHPVLKQVSPIPAVGGHVRAIDLVVAQAA